MGCLLEVLWFLLEDMVIAFVQAVGATVYERVTGRPLGH